MWGASERKFLTVQLNSSPMPEKRIICDENVQGTHCCIKMSNWDDHNLARMHSHYNTLLSHQDRTTEQTSLFFLCSSYFKYN